MGITEIPMSIPSGSAGPNRSIGRTTWRPQDIAPMEEKKYNEFKLIGWVLFIGAMLYLAL
jgi:hypothetical protein